MTNQLIRSINAIYSSEFVLPTNSGTGALMAALYACDLADGDQVILPINACPSVLNAVAMLHLDPIFCDVNMDMQINLVSLSRHISFKTKAIIIIHRFGSTVDFEELRKTLDFINYRGFVIEDGAQAFGVRPSAVLKPEGISDIYISSFGAGKIIDADGGGVFLTNNSILYKRAYRFINHGADVIPFFQDFGLNLGLSRHVFPVIIKK